MYNGKNLVIGKVLNYFSIAPTPALPRNRGAPFGYASQGVWQSRASGDSKKRYNSLLIK
jgi:hypothetical protein